MSNTSNMALGLGALPLLALAPACGNAEKAEPSRPNIVFIMADDMGYECSGVYGGTYDTPNIDAMAERGIMFSHAYSQPLSTPSRVEVMTGKYNYKNYCCFGYMNQDQSTFGNLARAAGYKTAIVGKWQLGFNSGLPDHFGFDNYCLWQLRYYRMPNSERYAGALVEADGETIKLEDTQYGPEFFADYIDKFIDENKDHPFFLYYPMALIHDPFVSTPDSDDWLTNPQGRHQKDNRYFPDMVEYCDKNLGRVVEALKRNGIYDNTLVIFTGDNGTNRNIYSTMKDGRVIKGGKGSTTDAGTHVAFLATYGSRQGKHRICDDLVDFTDVMPTIAEAMGVRVPAEWDTDGRSFLPQVMGRKGNPRKWVFCHYDAFFKGVGQPNDNARRYIRDHRYKLYSTGEFYDIEADVLEENDIAAGTGSREAEKVRAFLSRELAKFPAWKVGDIPVEQVMLPEYPSVRMFWTEKDE